MARSRRDDDDGGVLETGSEVIDRDAQQGPALPVSDLDAVDLEGHGGAPVDPRHPRDESMLADVEGVGLAGHAAIIECSLYNASPRALIAFTAPVPDQVAEAAKFAHNVGFLAVVVALGWWWCCGTGP